MKLTLNQEQLAHLKTIDKKSRQMSFLLECLVENILVDSAQSENKKIVVEKIIDNNLKDTGYENLFFKVRIPMGMSFEESLRQLDEIRANEFISPEKAIEILSEEKEKEIVLNNEYLQKVLGETHDVKFFRDLQRICVKCQNYEYATKFRQKVWDILVTLSTEKLIELVQDGTIELRDMVHAIGRKTNKFANDNIGTAEFTKEKYAPKNPLTIDQIETVIDWMNTWEQLKGTVIPIRFKEDFANKL